MIVVEALQKVYPGSVAALDAVAVDHVSFTAPRGATHGVLGPAGAGKSTLVRLLTMIERPTSGRVIVDGVEVTALPDAQLWAARRRIGLLLDGVHLLASRTVAQAVAHPLEVAGVSFARRASRVEELLDVVGLGGRGDAYPDRLTGGERQRAGLARALATDPVVLICDDPTAALPTVEADRLLALIEDLSHRTGLTVVLAGEDTPALRAACTSVTCLERGRVVDGVDRALDAAIAGAASAARPVRRESVIGQRLALRMPVNGVA